MTPEEWLANNTVKCPVGRVSKRQCEALRARPTFEKVINDDVRHWNWTGGNDPFMMRPKECEGCVGWEALRKEQEAQKMDADMKICRICKKAKPLSEYWRDAKTKDGLKTACKDCCRVQKRAYKARLKAEKERKKNKQTVSIKKQQLVALKNARDELISCIEEIWEQQELLGSVLRKLLRG